MFFNHLCYNDDILFSFYEFELFELSFIYLFYHLFLFNFHFKYSDRKIQYQLDY